MKYFSKLKSYGPLLIAFAAVLWALDGLLRRSLYSLEPIVIVFYEHLIGGILLLPILWKEKKQLVLSKKDAGMLFSVAILSSVLGTLWFTTALLKVEFISFSVVILLQKLQPLFAISAAVLLLKEKITGQYIKWALLALISAFFVTFPNGTVNLNTGSGTIIAAFYAIGAAFAWGSTTALSRKLLQKNPAGVITALRFMYATLFAGLWILLAGKFELLKSPSYSQLVRLLLIAFSTGMVALYIYYQGLKKTQVRVSTIVELIFPMLAVVIDIVIFKSVLLPSQYLAAGILVFAIYKVSLLNKK